MDALKSYSGEESSSEDEVNEKDLNDSACGQDKEVVGDTEPKAAIQKEHESPPAPPSGEAKEKEEEKREVESQSGHGHRRRKSRSRSKSRDPSPSDRDREPSRYKRSRDHPKQQSTSACTFTLRHHRDRRVYERRRSRSRSRSPPSRHGRRGSYHRRRSRSRSPPSRRSRRSRSPDHRRRRRRSSSSDRRGSRRRSGSPTERGGRDEERAKDDGGLNQHSSTGKTETTPIADTSTPGLSTTATQPPTVPGQTIPEPAIATMTSPVSGTATAASPGVVAGQGVQLNPLAGVVGGVTVPLLPPPDLSTLTPEQRLELILAANRAKGPQLPSFMNPTAMNPLKFQQIKEKRKLLWSGKKTQKQSHNQWEAVSLGTDDKDTAKFRRLMGISSSSSAATSSSSGDKDVREEHSKRLNVLEQQYESSRYQTHIARGVGLGYGSAALTTELPSQKDSGDKLDEKL